MDNTVSAEELIDLALLAKNQAYAPYSHFHVGAALLADNGKVYTGCNIENASYGATICAERVAIGKAVSEGARKILIVAVASDSHGPTMPCGICRQFLSEFCEPGTLLHLSDHKGNYKTFTFDALLPGAFKSGAFDDINKD